MWLLELTQPSIYLRISLISKTIPTLFTKIRNYDINFWDHSALSMMYSHFSTNKFEAIQNELSNSDLELEPEIQQEEVKLVTFSYPFLGESTLSVQLVGDFNNWDTNNTINMPLEKDWMFMTKLWLPTDKAYQYRFIINGSLWENTANASQYVSTPFGSENMILAV